MRQRIFSGIKPSGDLHIGNYLGAIKQWFDMQQDFDEIVCVVDQHAITVPQRPDDLRRRTIEIAKIYLASGIDPRNTILFVQSQVPAHTELGWILNTIARNGDLTKMTQFKDKSGVDLEGLDETVERTRLQQWKKQFNAVGVGLFDYPVLMAADILLYDTHVVPVGEDQTQHVELTRTLARRFNDQFGETFVIPKSNVKTESARIMALDDPMKKMSKSSKSEYGYITLLDDVEIARKKIMKAVTDSGAEILYVEEKPALKNLINIFSSLSGESPEKIVQNYAGKGYADFKRGLAEVVALFLNDFQQKFYALSDEMTLNILRDGAMKASAIAEQKMKTVRERVGFLV